MIQKALYDRSFSSRRGQFAAAAFVGVKGKNNGSFASKYSLLGSEPLFHSLLIARWPRRYRIRAQIHPIAHAIFEGFPAACHRRFQ